MSIPPSLASEFPHAVQVRGSQYRSAGRVHVLDADDDRVNVLVRGTLPYHVSIARRPDGIVVISCSCPYVAEQGMPCKHLWAALLEADRLAHPLVDDAADEGWVVMPTEDEPTPASRRRTARAGAVPHWKRDLQRLAGRRSSHGAASAEVEWPADRRLVYVVDAAGSPAPDHGLLLELATQIHAREGWKSPRRYTHGVAEWLAVPDEADREIAQMLLGAREEYAYGYAGGEQGDRVRRFFLRASSFATMLPRLGATGRCRIRLRTDDHDPPPLAWDDRGSWELSLELVARADGRCRLEGVIARGGERLPLAQPALLAAGLVVLDVGGVMTAAPFRDYGAIELVRELRRRLVLDAPIGEGAALAAEIGAIFTRLPPVELPEAFGVEVVRLAPRPILTLRGARPDAATPKVDATLAFEYGDARIDAAALGTTVPQPDPKRVVYRDRSAEGALLTRLESAGFRREYDRAGEPFVHRVAASRAMRAAGTLAADGWEVRLDERRVRAGRSASLVVRSGVDWFELDGTLDFGGVDVRLPELLAALRRGDRTVALGDGSLGLVSDEWAARYETIAGLGARVGDELRFAPGQASLLDALLATVTTADVDETFARARAQLREAEAVGPLDPPPGFAGELRPYQRVGLGWLELLRRCGFGAALADDMGLGKTVQVLALLEMRRQAGAGPSLAVVPASLVYNWVSEARRFTPELRVLVHHGARRAEHAGRRSEFDLIVTTYGTLRRDAVEFRDDEFEYVILDEAQAIKNAGTATAKAARLLRARHRLAMSGTPIENRLDDLWSLFEFLNPGMLGAAPAFARLVRAGAEGSEEGRAIVARGVRPFLLRRTKEQVARELPERTEQTVWVELSPTERRLYDELRVHFRTSLRERVQRDGLARSRMHVLEALLRLRQAACHPGLVDPARATESSSKLDVLMSQLTEIVAEGHKALVFSQFTSLLAILRTQLDAAGVTYEYLDGRTRDRERHVERFQTDPACPLFLVSLKAGGVGLNLTAADYVFLLDPWWNPAVEAQAIDRAHRIGQTRRVLALRLVARGTIEEKVLELQRGKRELADAIVRADDTAAAGLTADELRMLLE